MTPQRQSKSAKRKKRERRSKAIERAWLRWNRQWDGGPPYFEDESKVRKERK